MKLIFIVNVDWFFLSHRIPIAIEAIKRGYKVIIITKNTGYKKEIESYGINFINLPFDRSKFNPINEYKIYRKLKKILSEESPCIIHNVTLKPIILGSLAANGNNNISVINAVSGLGILFSDSGSKIKRILVLKLLKKAFLIKNFTHTIFQNEEDKDIFIANNLVKRKQYTLIKGSGIDLNEFSFSPIKIKPLKKVLIAGRMIYPKGFDDFSKAAAIINNSGKYLNVSFEMAGALDLINPARIPQHIINKWEKERNVKWLGHVTDMKSKITEADIVVFPSYYGEGVPKFLIEACAIGRPIITTNRPGCNDCVANNVNGFLIEPKKPEQLANKIMLLLDNHSLCKEFGEKSRIKAENEFSIESVISKTFEIYRL